MNSCKGQRIYHLSFVYRYCQRSSHHSQNTGKYCRYKNVDYIRCQWMCIAYFKKKCFCHDKTVIFQWFCIKRCICSPLNTICESIRFNPSPTNTIVNETIKADFIFCKIYLFFPILHINIFLYPVI